MTQRVHEDDILCAVMRETHAEVLGMCLPHHCTVDFI